MMDHCITLISPSLDLFALATLFGVTSLLTKKITFWGALSGTLITYALMEAFGIVGLLAIGLFFVLGTGASVWKKSQKQTMGVEEANQGKRGYANVLGNAASAFILSVIAIFFPESNALLEIMMVASFAAALSDTVSSELGNIYGTKFIDIISLKVGVRGEDGIISMEGTLAGLLASSLMGMVYYLVKGDFVLSLVITVSGFFGNLVDSLLGSSLQKKRILNNHGVNFFNTLLAALLASILVAE